MIIRLPLAILAALCMSHPASAAAVSLPIEIMGPDGASSTVNVSVPGGSAGTRLWLQAHNLSYQDKASIRVNGGSWISLNNSSSVVHVADPGKAHGGIGGGFMSLKLTIDLPAGSCVDGSNTFAFRFNATDGRSSGWRVLAFNVLDASGVRLIPAGSFVADDPATWTPPLPEAADIAAGESLWDGAALIQRPGGGPILANCASCHAADGRDLQYFSFSNHAIIERSKFHGLTQTQGSQIASYIRSLAVPTHGRPWDPPYQPGPGLDAKPVEQWSAGAGLDWVLDDDVAVAPYLPGQGTDRSALVDANRHFITYNRRETPLAFQFLDWNHWLPEIHPIDALGRSTFEAHGAWTIYVDIRRGLLGLRGMSKQTYIFNQLRTDLDTWKNYISGDDSRIPNIGEATGRATTLENYRKTYAANLWSGVKLWEIMQEFGLEALGEQFYGRNGEPRQWFSNRHIFNFAPHIISNDDTRDKLVVGDHDPMRMFNYLSDAWYEMQLILNPGARNAVKGGHHDDDWKYLWYFAGASSDVFEPMQGLALGWKSIQEMDHGWGPDGRDRSPGDNTWWGYSLRDGRPNMGHILEHDDWPGFTRAQARPYIQTIYTAFVEKVSTFTIAQWAKADTTEFSRAASYVWSSSNVDESIPDIMRFELNRMANIYQVDDALVNGYADWGKALWPANNWAQYRRADVGITAPTGLVATAQVNRVSLSWSAVAGATSYNVKRSEASDGVYLPAGLFVSGTDFIDPLLQPGRAWFYRVSANLGRGEGPASASVQATPLRGMVARWGFDEGTGDVAADNGPFAMHGHLFSGPTRTTGTLGNALALGGTAFVGVDQNLGRWLSNTFTLTAWVKTSTNGNNTLQDAPAITGSTQNDIFDSDRMLILGALDAGGRIGVKTNYYGPEVKSTAAINDGSWHHVAITRNADTGVVRLLIDGGNAVSNTLQTGNLYQRTWSLGRVEQARSGNYWQGGLDDVRIYDQVLDDAGIQAVYADRSTTPVNQPPTVAITAPATAAVFTTPVSVTITAAASDPDGTITKVEFFAGTNKIGEDAAAPWQVAWAPSGLGTFQLTSRATDNNGSMATSPAVSVRINGPLGDLDGDGQLTTADLIILRGQYGRTGIAITPGSADLDGNDRVDAVDLGIFNRAMRP